MDQQHTNRLIHEKSPYLLQHAHNPVDWYPWGDEAFEKAREENKPIFLSIGYATCHWCHVMERESFESDSVAAFLNQHFVAIKVDREERPDVDQVYMTAVQAMTGQGGWPLSVFLTPDLEPFYGGTYFPPVARYGRPGFLNVLRQVASAWKNNRAEIEQVTRQIQKVLEEVAIASEPSSPDPSLLETAFSSYVSQFDSNFGGFGGAPKFPRPMDVQFLLRYFAATKEEAALKMALSTLDHMAAGGIYDHVGGGFHRYATDQRWLVPHFEKMLYDNALLVIAFSEAFQLTGNKDYARVVEDVLSYITRELTDKRGGFYSAQDADSEGEEGKYYIWRYDEVQNLLSEREFSCWRLRYGLTQEGNFEGGHSIFHIQTSVAEIAKRLRFSEAEVQDFLSSARKKLFAARQKRTKPLTDDKILTSWSSLMISAFARAARVLGNSDYAERALKATDFILKEMVKHGHLLHRYREGVAEIEGFMEDYAFFIQALLDVYELTFEPSHLQQALRFNQKAHQLFWDDEHGGYFFASEKAGRLPVRIKDSYDGAIPSANSMMALNLLRLAEYTMNDTLRQKAQRLIGTHGNRIRQSPLSYAQMLLALDFDFRGAKEIVLRSPSDSFSPVLPFLKYLSVNFVPNRVIAVVTEENYGSLAAIIPWVRDRQPVDHHPTVYICQNFTCKRPVTSLEAFKQLLQE